MSRVCQITGKSSIGGNHVSHANNKTKRRFYPNLFDKKYFLEEEKRWVTLRVSANGMRTITKKGLTKAIKDAQAKGYLKKI